jgi:hypothetical protein
MQVITQLQLSPQFSDCGVREKVVSKNTLNTSFYRGIDNAVLQILDVGRQHRGGRF